MRAQMCGRGVVWLVLTALMFGLPAAGVAEETPEVIENETGIYYTIRKGDTLWDLSERFSDSPWQWPNLWEENDQISNPHWIYPGEKIRLFRKQDLEKIVKKPEAPDTEEPPAVEPEPEEERPFLVYTKIEAVGFVRKAPLVSSGTIFKVRGDHELISTGDHVYIEANPNSPSMAIGERYTIYRNERWIGEVKEELRDFGKQYLLVGVVEIVDKEGGVWVGRIVRSYRSIHVNDRLIPYVPRSPKITLAEPQTGFQGRIFLAEEHQENIAADHIVFIDRGANDGIERGQIYKIYYRESDQRNPNKAQLNTLETIPFGQLVVLHTEPTTATCLVLNSRQQVQPGAVVGNFTE